MTSPNDPWSNPYGQPGHQSGQQPGQQGQPQYTQPLYGQPEGQQHRQPEYGQPQYGGPPQYGQPYGQPPYGPPRYGGPYGPRPSSGSLVTAGVIQIVQSAFWLIIGIVLVAVASALSDILRDAGISENSSDDVKTVAVVIGLVILLVAAAMIVLAALTMRRSNGCRIASIVLEIIFAVFWVLATISSLNNDENPVFPLLFLASCIAVVVLLFTGSAKAATAGPR